MAIERGSIFDCPECDTTAPSTSVPYDSLGYVMCPTCGYTSGPDDDGSGDRSGDDEGGDRSGDDEGGDRSGDDEGGDRSGDDGAGES